MSGLSNFKTRQSSPWRQTIAILSWQALTLTALISAALWLKPEPAVAQASSGGPTPTASQADCEPTEITTVKKVRRGRPLGIGLGI